MLEGFGQSYTIWDVYDCYYDDIVVNLLKEHKKLFSNGVKPNNITVDTVIKSLIHKGIVKCKIYFREHGKHGFLKPCKILSLSKDIEYDVISEMDRMNKELEVELYSMSDDYDEPMD